MYAADEFRMSHHDAVVEGLCLAVSETQGFILIVLSRLVARFYDRSVRGDPLECRSVTPHAGTSQRISLAGAALPKPRKLVMS